MFIRFSISFIFYSVPIFTCLLAHAELFVKHYINNELLLVVLKTFRDCQGYQVKLMEVFNQL